MSKLSPQAKTINFDKFLENKAITKIDGKISLTKWVAKNPITKKLAIEPDGTLKKSSTASQLSAGEVQQLELSPKQFVQLLNNIGTHDCLSYGKPKEPGIFRVLSEARFKFTEDKAGVITRTNKYMEWPKDLAIMMIDYDPEFGKSALSKVEFLNAFYLILPDLTNCAHIWVPSTSSCLYDNKSKKWVRGIEGQRLYIIVSNGTDIPRAAEVLYKRLWLDGHGYFKISRAGSLLPRTLMDASVYQPNRIDFCAAPECTPPLISKKPAAKMIGDTSMALATFVALPNLSDQEENTYQKLLTQEKSKKQVEANTIKETYLTERIEKLVANGIQREQAEKTIRHALDCNVLHGDFQLQCTDGLLVSVSDLLSDPGKFHGQTFADPIEPDYHNDLRIANAKLLGVARPYLYSYAHGGQFYYLAKQLHTIRLAKGERGNNIKQIVTVLVEQGAVYKRGNTLVSISDSGNIKLLDDYSILACIDQNVRLEESKNGKEAYPTDGKLEHARIIQSAHFQDFKPLNSLLTAPTICPVSGEIIASPGYDEQRGFFITNEENFQPISLTPTIQHVSEALKALWHVVHLFPFVSKIDQTVMLVAMFTVVIRKVIPTAPGFGFDSPSQGSGKTLLIKLLSALAGEKPTISPQPDKSSDEEMRKRLFALLRGGNSVIVIDNIVGSFDSPALAALITSEQYSDRVLGLSKTETVLNNATILISGNNLTPKGDLPRRIMVSRIDPKNETPHERSFDFDPVTVVTEYRQELVSAVLTIIRAYMLSTKEMRYGKGKLASFEQWDDLVRQPICWLSKLQSDGLVPIGKTEDGSYFPELVDPMEAVNAAVKHDPIRERHGNLLKVIASKYGAGSGRGNLFSTRQLIKASLPDYISAAGGPEFKDDDDRETLNYLLTEVAGDPIKHLINHRSLGNYFSKHQDRIVDGFCLRKGADAQNSATWWIEDVGGGLSGFYGLKNDYAQNNSDVLTMSLSHGTKPTKPPTSSVELTG